MTIHRLGTTARTGLNLKEDQRLLRSTKWPQASSGSRVLRIADLFCGAGGMSLGAFLAAKQMRMRFEIALAAEFDMSTAEIYRYNLGRFFEREDSLVIRPIEEVLDGNLFARMLTPSERRLRKACMAGGPVDLLMGGPPCQGHSDLNNHTRRVDPRNDLYGRMARAARVLQPSILIIENVKQVVHDRGGVVSRTRTALEKRYSLRPFVLRFEELGVPQHRHRHVLVGVRRDRDPEARLDALQLLLDRAAELASDRAPRDVDWALSDLEGHYQGEGRGYDHSTVPSPENRSRLQWFESNRGKYNLPDHHRPPCHARKAHSYRAVYGRLNPSEPANTITTGYGSMGQGRYVHPSESRTITPHEAARLQTFPDFFQIAVSERRTAWARAIGNAVPPLGIREVIRVILADP